MTETQKPLFGPDLVNRRAQALIDLHGDRAATIAATIEQTLWQKGDTRGTTLWRDIRQNVDRYSAPAA